jgi:hypothetical protein
LVAYVRIPYRTDGTPYFSVYWREGRRQGRQECTSWNDRADADHCQNLTDQFGGKKARDIVRIVQAPRQSLTVAQFLTKHIDHLTGVQAGTLKR